jgi:phosphatidylglycerol:prolipoprotein diacylglycerol transferase
MRPDLFTLPFNSPFSGKPVELHSYGLMMVLGFLAGLQLARYLARRSRIDPDIFVNAALIALVTGVLGARISHVLENIAAYTNPQRSAWENFKDAIDISSGGLTFYGGFLLAFPCTLLYGIWKKVPVKRGMDIVAPCLMIGLGFGRVGCFLNGCCEGGQCDVASPLAVEFPYNSNPYVRQFNEGTLGDQAPPPEAIHESGRKVLGKEELAEKYRARLAAIPPSDVEGRRLTIQERDDVLAKVSRLHSQKVYTAQLYSTVTAWLIALLLVAYYTLPHAPGRVFALMLMVESPSRFLLEMLRAEPAFIGRGTTVLSFLPPLTFSMFLSVWLFLLGVGLWFAFRGKVDDMTEPSVSAGRLVAA